MKYRFQLFKHYYQESYTLEKVVLPDLKFRHFRFQLFSKRNVFRRLVDIITSPSQLRGKLVRYVPMNAYFTPVKWLNPIYVSHTKDELDVMLSAPLFFDIDMQSLSPPTFSEAKADTSRLIEFLEEEYGRRADMIVFSGRQGFHVYFWDWDGSKILGFNCRERIVEFRRRRNAILESLRKRRIFVDEKITSDPFRIMKIPNTLHGKTGLVATPTSNVDRFAPRKEALAFDVGVHERIFGLDWEIYE